MKDKYYNMFYDPKTFIISNVLEKEHYTHLCKKILRSGLIMSIRNNVRTYVARRIISKIGYHIEI